VREQIKGGADCIKVMSTGGLSNYPHERPDIDQYTVDELTAAATETHRFGKLIATHAMSDRAVSRAIQAGIDTIEHAFLASADGIKLMGDSDVAFVPTARVSWRTARTASPELASLLSEANHAQRILEASELGVKIGVGTDSRFTMIEEMETLVDYGMPVQTVIQGATGTAADICGLEGVGIVAPGMTADLLLLGSNPLNGLRSAFEKLKMVVQRGEVTVSASDTSVALRPMTPPGPLD
jgi:imidazolonepropionase-like amidohydrolase